MATPASGASSPTHNRIAEVRRPRARHRARTAAAGLSHDRRELPHRPRLLRPGLPHQAGRPGHRARGDRRRARALLHRRSREHRQLRVRAARLGRGARCGPLLLPWDENGQPLTLYEGGPTVPVFEPGAKVSLFMGYLEDGDLPLIMEGEVVSLSPAFPASRRADLPGARARRLPARSAEDPGRGQLRRHAPRPSSTRSAPRTASRCNGRRSRTRARRRRTSRSRASSTTRSEARRGLRPLDDDRAGRRRRARSRRSTSPRPPKAQRPAGGRVRLGPHADQLHAGALAPRARSPRWWCAGRPGRQRRRAEHRGGQDLGGHRPVALGPRPGRAGRHRHRGERPPRGHQAGRRASPRRMPSARRWRICARWPPT